MQACPFVLDRLVYVNRFDQNLEAIKLLKSIEHSERTATPAERKILAHYSAFGQSANLSRLQQWNDVSKRLEIKPQYDFMTEREVASIKRAALTAFYTPIDVVQAFWIGLYPHIMKQQRLRVLEPSAGVGHFISGAPEDLRSIMDFTAVELDDLTGRLLQHIHGDTVDVRAGVGLENAGLLDNSFDLAIGNVPFGDIPVIDRGINEYYRRTIHDYFLGKLLRVVRPGGIIAVLTSWGTMDKKSEQVRQLTHEQAELVAAIRLPTGVFEHTSGSLSACDLLIFRKRAQRLPAGSSDTWVSLRAMDWQRKKVTQSGGMTTGSRYSTPLPKPKKKKGDPPADPDAPVEVDVSGVPLMANSYWKHYPEHIVGRPQIVEYDASVWAQVHKPESGTAHVFAKVLSAAIPPEMELFGPDVPEEKQEVVKRDKPAPVPIEQLIEQMQGKDKLLAESLAAMYKTAKEVLHRDLVGLDSSAERKLLNSQYELHCMSYGIISQPKTLGMFRNLPELSFLQALEEHAEQLPNGKWKASKARIFREPVVRGIKQAEPGSMQVDEAITYCLNTRSDFNISYIAMLTGKPNDKVLDELGERVFRVPGTDRYELRDMYLSGNVRVKLDSALAWVERDAQYQRNVDALKAVQPTPLGPEDIIVQLSAMWLPDDVMTEFVVHLLPGWKGAVRYNHALGEWKILDPDNQGAWSVGATTTWGTSRANVIELLHSSMQNKQHQVNDPIGDGKYEVNAQESIAAQDKQKGVEAEFQKWIWATPERATRLCAIYNERFNSNVLRKYDGSHLQFPGMNTSILRGNSLDDYQKDAVWQIMQSPSALIAFDVGGGKTFTSIAGVMESLRIGVISKALIVVPNHLVPQWGAEVHRLYPGYQVLAMGPEDFEKSRRGVVLSRIATGSWDVVIIGETSMKFLPMDLETIREYRRYETDHLRSYLEELNNDSHTVEDKKSVKAIEKAVLKLEARLDAMEQEIRRDSERNITWRELGIDCIVVDEAHSFKNLGTPSKLRVSGIPSAGSQRALDMRIKTWDMQRRGNCKVIFLTATPIMNSIVEVYVMQKYLQEQVLLDAGIRHLDQWISLFAQATTALEMKPDGSGFRMFERLRTFINIPDLSVMWRANMTVRTKEDMMLPEPKLVTTKPITVVVPPSEALKTYIQEVLVKRVDKIKSGEVKPEEDNMLKVTGDGRKAALDMRLIFPGTPRRKRTKIMELVVRAATIYREFDPMKGTQIVFCDLATPKGKAGGEKVASTTAKVVNDDGTETEVTADVETASEKADINFVYHEIRSELVKQGIPAEEIAFIHDYNSKRAKEQLYAAMNAGRIRILLGSTGKMSTGLNVQQRLVALHNLDCPWRPGDLIQRNGRIIRQGNMWPEVYVFNYVTEGSFDGYMWQTIETKQRYITQVMKGNLTMRKLEDVSEMVLSIAEVKALASGNPMVMRKIELELELNKMDRIRAVHIQNYHAIQTQVHYRTGEKESAELMRDHLLAAIDLAKQTEGQEFSLEAFAQLGKAEKVTFTERKAAGQHLLAQLEQLKQLMHLTMRPQHATIAWFRGFRIDADVNGGGIWCYLIMGKVKLDEISTRTEQGIIQSLETSIRTLPQWVEDKNKRVEELEKRIGELHVQLIEQQEWPQEQQFQTLKAELDEIDRMFEADGDEAPAPDGQPAETTQLQTAVAELTQDQELAKLIEMLALDADTGEDYPLPVLPVAELAMEFMKNPPIINKPIIEMVQPADLLTAPVAISDIVQQANEIKAKHEGKDYGDTSPLWVEAKQQKEAPSYSDLGHMIGMWVLSDRMAEGRCGYVVDVDDENGTFTFERDDAPGQYVTAHKYIRLMDAAPTEQDIQAEREVAESKKRRAAKPKPTAAEKEAADMAKLEAALAKQQAADAEKLARKLMTERNKKVQPNIASMLGYETPTLF